MPYLADLGAARLAGRRFPRGNLLVNLSGSFALGLVTTALPDAVFLLSAGLVGGYMSFSAAMLDTVALWRDGGRPAFAFNAIGLLLGLLSDGLGLTLGAVL